MAKAGRYSVYHIKTEMPLIIYGTSRECAEAMGVTLNSFYRSVMRMREGKIHMRKWAVYEDEVEELEEEDDVQETEAESAAEEMPELKPCPFCDGKAATFWGYSYDVYCTSCHARISLDGMEDTIEAWNRRTEDGKL